MRAQAWMWSVPLAALTMVGFVSAVEGCGEAADRWTPGGPTVGARVRVEAPEQFGGRRTGTVVERLQGGLVVRFDGGRALLVRRAAIRSLDVSLGRRRHTRTGALAGAAVGLVGGFVYLTAISTSSDTDFRGGQYLVATLGGAALGATLGSAIGFLVETERWQPSPVRVSVRPTAGRGVAVRVRVEF